MLAFYQHTLKEQDQLLLYLATLTTPFHVNEVYPAMKNVVENTYSFRLLFIALYDKGYLRPVGIDDEGDPLPILFQLTEPGLAAARIAA